MNAAVGRDPVYKYCAVNAIEVGYDVTMTLRVSKHSNLPCSVIFVNFYNFLNNDVIMSSLVSSGNCKWVTTADGCVHTADSTRLDSFVPSASAVCIGHKKKKA